MGCVYCGVVFVMMDLRVGDWVGVGVGCCLIAVFVVCLWFDCFGLCIIWFMIVVFVVWVFIVLVDIVDWWLSWVFVCFC